MLASILWKIRMIISPFGTFGVVRLGCISIGFRSIWIISGFLTMRSIWAMLLGQGWGVISVLKAESSNQLESLE